MTNLLRRCIIEPVEDLGSFCLFAWEAIGSSCSRRGNWGDLPYQLYFIGVKSQTVVLITGAFTGMVLAAQTYFQFHKVKMDTATLAVVSVSMCSELGPVLAALMVVGRVGAAMAAQLGTMRVTEQVDALRTLATHPIDYLVVPRFLATVIAMPLLVTEAIAIGIAAGYIVGVQLLNIDGAYLWNNMLLYTDPADVFVGVIKAACFGALIALICSYRGMHCGEGADGVGRATTEAVVQASIAVLISNFFLTLLLNRLFG